MNANNSAAFVATVVLITLRAADVSLAAPTADAPNYLTEVRPILADNCFPAPVMQDADGKYPVPMPGITVERENETSA
ncbi:MAG: hypothetical protein L0228_18255 [Planctomycetes bacterium]|nr:hypothetical protein [Planctomycetota bacterium]